MADVKISALNALGTSPAADDLIPVVDVTATETKKLRIDELFTNPDVTGTLTTDGVFSSEYLTVSGGKGLQSINTININADYDASGAGGINLKTKDILRIQIENDGNIAFCEDTGTTAKFYWDASAESLGLGTSSPATALEVKGDGAAIQVSSVDYDVALLGRRGSSGVDIDKGYMRLRDTGTTKVAIDSAGDSYFNGGNVGIGTSSVSEKLTVNGNAILTDGFKIYGNSNAGSTSSYLSLYNAVDGGIDLMANYSTSKITFGTNATERVRIDSDGNVGIGTTNPSTILGSTSLEVSSATGSEVIVFRDDGSAVDGDFCGGFVIGNRDASGTPNHYAGMWATTDEFGQMTLKFAGGRESYEAGTSNMAIDSSGNVGIGTTSPSQLLDLTQSSSGSIVTPLILRNPNSAVSGTGTKIYFSCVANNDRGSYIESASGASNATYLSFGTNTVGSDATERMRIDSSGNLLVGTTQTPATLITTSTTSHAGVGIADGYLSIARDLTGSAGSGGVAFFNRLATDGPIADFRKDGTTVGKMATTASGFGFVADSPFIERRLFNTGIRLGNQTVNPAGTDGAYRDDGIDLGFSSVRWKNLYLSGGIINPNGDLSITQQGASNDLILSSDRSIRIFNSSSEAARFDSSGNLLVGKSASSFTTDGIEAKADGQLWVTDTSGSPLFLSRKTTDGAIATFCKEAATVGSIGISSSGFYIDGEANHIGLRFGSSQLQPRLNGSELDAGVDLGSGFQRFKDLYLSGGVYLGGTGADNLLDDYEEGTFTPVIEGTTTAGTGTYSTQQGKYTKIGRAVHFQISLTWSAHTGTGNLDLSGLPFTAESTNNYVSCSIHHENLNTSNSFVSAIVSGGTTRILLRQTNSNSAAATIPMLSLIHI